MKYDYCEFEKSFKQSALSERLEEYFSYLLQQHSNAFKNRLFNTWWKRF